MKNFICFLILLTSCKKQDKFSDKIELVFDKNINTTFNKFNEGLNEPTGKVLYVGKEKSKIDVKYYLGISVPPPPPPSGYDRFQRKKDSLNSLKYEDFLSKYIRNNDTRIIYSEKEVSFSILNNENTKIEVKPYDTIPQYAFNQDSLILKKYKAFPVFIKNISKKPIILADINGELGIEIKNKLGKWQIIRNNNWMICGNGFYKHFHWNFMPDEIIVFPVKYYAKGDFKTKFRINFLGATSQEYDINISSNVLKNQR